MNKLLEQMIYSAPTRTLQSMLNNVDVKRERSINDILEQNRINAIIQKSEYNLIHSRLNYYIREKQDRSLILNRIYEYVVKTRDDPIKGEIYIPAGGCCEYGE